MSALWGLTCHHDYLDSEVLCLLVSDQRVEPPSGPDQLSLAKIPERKEMRNPLRVLVETMERMGSHHRLRALPGSGVIQSHCGQSCYGDYFFHLSLYHPGKGQVERPRQKHQLEKERLRLQG